MSLFKVAILSLCVVVGATYALNRGLFIGSTVLKGSYYYLECRYLFPSGVLKKRLGGWNSAEELRAHEFCTAFYL